MKLLKSMLTVVVTIVLILGIFVAGAYSGYQAGGQEMAAFLHDPSTPVVHLECGSLHGAGQLKIYNWTGEQYFEIRCTKNT